MTPSAIGHACPAPGCPEVVTRGWCPRHTGKRWVVAGPPGSGKTTWVRERARQGDLVWDLDEVASVVSYGGAEIPRRYRGMLPSPTIGVVLAMREAFLEWVAEGHFGPETDVYVIVSDVAQAKGIARRIRGKMRTLLGGI